MGANPVDRGKPGSKLHLVCEGGRLPLPVVVTAANLADTTMFAAVLDDVPPIRTPVDLLQAAAGPLGPGLGAVVRLGAGGLRADLLQPL